MTSTRTVRQLRLKAGSRDAIRRAALLLEDALRTATLPGDGGRLVLVRHLALGTIDNGAAPQSLALALESAVARLGHRCCHGGAADAASAPAVWFRDALDAHLCLALVLAAGGDCKAWFWPLAIPSWQASLAAAPALRRLAYSLARLPEAASALPHWVLALVQAGHGPLLLTALSAQDSAPLARAAGLNWPALAAGSSAMADSIGTATAPMTLLLALLQAAQAPAQILRRLARAEPAQPPTAPWPPTAQPVAAPTESMQRGESAKSRLAPPRAGQIALPEAEPSPLTASVARFAPSLIDRDHAAPGLTKTPMAQNPATGTRLAHTESKHRPGNPARGSNPPQERAAQRPPPHQHAGDTRGFQFPAGAVTAAGGVLFVLPALRRLGLADWLAQHEAQDVAFVRRLLACALARLALAADDPAWQLTDSAALAPLSAPAPLCWQDQSLAPPRGRPGAPPQLALARAKTGDQQALLWLTLLRRWLRRSGGPGLASLILRPGRLSLTPTHVDLHFQLDDTDLRIRRLGLDLDPGWLPWFGRVVSFHYQD